MNGQRHPLPARMARFARALRRNRSGAVAVEFALGLPLIVTMMTYGAEAANTAYATQLVGDITVQTADSLARVRNSISEADVTEALNGIKTLGSNINFSQNGRIIVSSVKPVLDGSGNLTNQNIRWQRCMGALNQNSSYGVQGDNVGVTGIGPTGRKIATTTDTEIIFVEVRYTYQPLISNRMFGARTITSIAALTVRDRTANDLVNSGTASSCSTYAA